MSTTGVRRCPLGLCLTHGWGHTGSVHREKHWESILSHPWSKGAGKKQHGARDMGVSSLPSHHLWLLQLFHPTQDISLWDQRCVSLPQAPQFTWSQVSSR